MEQIAILSANGQPADLTTARRVLLFEKTTDQTWMERKAFSFALLPTTNTGQLRDQVRNLITKLDSCRIIAGHGINGLAYHVLDRMGLHIFEITALNANVLQGIWDDVEKSEARPQQDEEVPLSPTPVAEGIYYLDFIRLQQLHPEISSKRALQPFLQNTPFNRLNLLCSHLPLWFQEPAYKQNYFLRTKKYGGNLLISISRRTCKEE